MLYCFDTYAEHLFRWNIWIWYDTNFFQNAASVFIRIWNVTAMWYKQGSFFIADNMEMSDQRTVTGSAPNQMAMSDSVKFNS